MKSNLHPQRCHHGRRGKMAPSNQQEDEEAGEGAMNIPHTEDEEAMNSKQEGEVDAAAAAAMTTVAAVAAAAAMTTVAAGEEEEISTKEAGQMEGAGEGAATKKAVIEIRVSSPAAITVATVVAIRAVVMVASRQLHTQEVGTRVVDISRTIDTKMVGITVIEAGVVEGEGVVEAEVDALAKEEVGEEEGARIIIKGGNLNSTSSMEVTSIIILDLDREDILVEAT